MTGAYQAEREDEENKETVREPGAHRCPVRLLACGTDLTPHARRLFLRGSMLGSRRSRRALPYRYAVYDERLTTRERHSRSAERSDQLRLQNPSPEGPAMAQAFRTVCHVGYGSAWTSTFIVCRLPRGRAQMIARGIRRSGSRVAGCEPLKPASRRGGDVSSSRGWSPSLGDAWTASTRGACTVSRGDGRHRVEKCGRRFGAAA